MKITFCPVDNNKELLEMSKEFYKHLGYPIVPHTQLDGWRKDSLNSLIAAIRQPLTEFTIFLDSDVFILRPELIKEMCAYMDENGIYYAGMPEKGVSSHRSKALGSHEDLMSCSFLIINNRLFRDGIIDGIDLMNYKKDIYCTDKNRYEPHWGAFRYFRDFSLPCINLSGADHPDGITTMLQAFPSNNYFAYHTWYGRDFNTNNDPETPNNRGRILARYDEAKKYFEYCKKAEAENAGRQ